MATLKRSKQRELIKKYLMSTKEHPTADTVYMKVREELPNISLGTVYRNLNLLSETGEAMKISTAQGGDRFDGNPNPHHHFSCTCCGRVFDLDLKEFPPLEEIAARQSDVQIDGYNIIFYGICKDCKKQAK